MSLDFRLALNTISDVVQNRPPPLREFDQIYMKVGDMVIQSEYIARAYNDMDVVFIGDGDAISLSIVHMKNKGVFDYGPKSIHVIDFDERIVNSINKFAIDNNLTEVIKSNLYNVADSLPDELVCSKDAFYTNPPWGASNDGASVTAFMQRGFETLRGKGLGVVVIADDKELDWTQVVLRNIQSYAIQNGFCIAEMIPGLHKYHLDDAPELVSCAILFRKVVIDDNTTESLPLNDSQLKNFYGANNPLTVKYVREKSSLHQGKAPEGSYTLEGMDEK